MTVANVHSRVAGLADSEQVISGVAVGVGDVTRGLSGDQKVWTAEELQAAADSLEGTPVNPLHSESAVGEVIRAGYDSGRGVVYEAELEDSSLARQVADGQLEVSIEARHADGGTVETDRGEAMAATDIQFTGIALVQHGAAPSASATPGEAAALSAADIRATLEEDDPASTEGDAEDIDISDQTETGLENKVEEHNEDAPESKQVTLGLLKKVYRRGAGAWFSSNKGATQQQWAYARVNAFLEDLLNDDPLNAGNDNDLAPDGYSPPEGEMSAGLVEVNGTEVDLSPPSRVVNAAEAALEAKEEFSDQIGDCGTGVGEQRANQIVDGDLAPEDFLTRENGTPYPTYLDSHSEDAPPTDDPPTDWGKEEWTDGCGPVQLALWGFYQDWAEGVKDELESAMEDEDMAYNRDEDANMAEVPDEFIFDNPGEAVEKAQEMGLEGSGDEIIHTHGEDEDTVFMPAPSHDDLMDMLKEMGEIETADMAETKNIGPIDFEGTSDGELDESEIPNDDFDGHYLNPGENKSDSSFPLVDGNGNLRRGNLDAGWNLRGQGDLGMPRDVAERVMLNLGLVFGPPDSEDNPLPQDAYEQAEEDGIEVGTPYAAEAAGEADDPITGEDSDTVADSTDDQSTRYNAHMSETEEELRARLSEKDDRIAELETEVEQLEDEREDVAREYAEALAGDSPFSADELAERFEVSELREKFEDTEDATLADTEPATRSGGSENTEEAELSDTEEKEVSEHREVIADLSGSDTTIAEKERERRAEQVAELTGEDTDTILNEA